MSIPITSEEDWLRMLANVPVWQFPRQPTVVISPHPDDETLGCGGLICRLTELKCDVSVIAVTDGENCYSGEHLGSERTVEQTAALRVLGVDSRSIHRLHLPDSAVSDHEEELVHALTALLPNQAHVVAPWKGDFHPDHEVCGRAAQRVATAKSLRLTSYFFWTWHRGTPELLRDLPLLQLPLTQAQQTAKRDALCCHRSQLQHAGDDPILPAHLLQPAWRGFEVFLPA